MGGMGHQIGIYLSALFARQPIAMVVASIISIQLVIIVSLLGLVGFQRVRRLFSRIRNKQREERIRRILIDYYFENVDKFQSPGTVVPLIKRKFGFWESRGFIRRILLQTSSRFSGRDHEVFSRLYRELGYLAEDLRQTKSWFWWKRLPAVIRLESLATYDAIPRLEQLIEDDHDIVALAAMRALSRLQYPNKIKNILDALSRRAPTRRDVFMSILSNLGYDNSDEILKYLFDCYDPYIASLCIRTLGDLKVERAEDYLLGLIKSSNDLVAAESIKALGRIRSQKSLQLIQFQLQHPVAEVRAEAVEAVARIMGKSGDTLLTTAMEDPDYRVRRSAYYAMKGGF